MSAPIVYEGVIPQDGNGGTLFKGMKFWVSSYVPNRHNLTQNIKSNGGKVVLLEKHADYILADHTKHNPPKDSYSWKFIDDSLDAGALKPMQEYQCREAPRTAWSVGSLISRKATRTPFTAEDDDILAKWVAQKQREDESILGNEIYRELEQKFPQHTMHSWRDRWLKHIKPRLENQGNNAAYESKGRGVSASSHNLNEDHRQGLLREDKNKNTSRQGDQEEGGDDNEDQEPLPGPPPVRAEASPVQSQEPQEDLAVDSQPPSPRPPPDGDVDQSEVESSLHAEKSLKTQFYEDYQTFNEKTDSQAQWWPSIKGQTFELWQLWQAVQSQKVGAEEHDWQQISETLGFNWVEDPEIPAEIRQYYETHLGDFEDGMLDFEEQSDDEDETQANAILGAPMASSPPALPPLKRSYDTALGSSHSYPNSSPKRSRLTRGNEVPSTPDDKNGTSNLRRQAASSKIESPTLGSHETTNLTPSRKLVAAPGLQSSRSQSLLEEVESQVNITPSQQLRSEFVARSEEVVTPTPARTAREPFIHDEIDEPDITPSASTAERTNAGSPEPNLPQSKRRSLPNSFNQPRFTRTSNSPASRPQRQSPLPQAKPQAPTRETPEDVIDFYMSLGYAQDVVVRSLDATTWVPGLASQLMEMLKKGESLPANWRGVWTQKDDEVLREAAADNQSPRGDVKEQRKKEKRLERLEKKHTPEGMDLRRAFLESRDREKRVRFAVSGGSRRKGQ